MFVSLRHHGNVTQFVMAGVDLKTHFSAERLEVPVQKGLYLEKDIELSHKNWTSWTRKAEGHLGLSFFGRAYIYVQH